MTNRPPVTRFPPRSDLAEVRSIGGQSSLEVYGPPGYLNTWIIQPQSERALNPIIPRGTVWARLQSPTHPDYAPYATVDKIGKDGRTYKVYPQNHDGCLSEGFDKSLLRVGEGQRFQKEHSSYPCPEGWLESMDRGYCERFGDPNNETRGILDGPPRGKNSGLYSNKAYIPVKQHFRNAAPPEWNNYSDSSYFRSHDFRTGGYTVFYPPHPDSTIVNRLPLRDLGDNVRYDPSWNLPPQQTKSKYARLSVSDSYL